MKKQLLLLLSMLSFSILMAQTADTVINKDSTTETTYQNVLPDYNGPCKCSNPMSSDEFNIMLTDIRMMGNDSRMFRFVKHEIRDKCLMASQVEEIMLLFMFDNYRYDFLKFARKYTYDQGNCYALRFKYQNPNGNYVHNKFNTHNELHDNWERTDQSKVVFTNWLYSSYGSSGISVINR